MIAHERPARRGAPSRPPRPRPTPKPRARPSPAEPGAARAEATLLPHIEDGELLGPYERRYSVSRGYGTEREIRMP